MRVVSQSKDVSLDFDRAVFTANHGMITAMVDGKTFTIGTYANLGREKEVFSDMHKAFSAFQVISTNMDKQQVAEMFAVSKNISIRCVDMSDPCMGITVLITWSITCRKSSVNIALSPSGKALDFDSSIRRFESC